MNASTNENAAVVVIGGGILGCSIAWHLARAGERKVVVVERNDIWSFDLVARMWTWLTGSNTTREEGVWNTKGVAVRVLK